MSDSFRLAALMLILIPATAGAQDSAAWNINQAFGPTKTIAFDTDEATWVNVTVSPDARTILFDVLGDVYAMPLGGTGDGFATRITSGPAYDMQPRFSPDGRWVAYISDEAGGHNVWLMRPDGTGKRQLTKESERLVNSPAWSPDGDYVYVRKHFIERRSLGAGEVWAYHVSGGTGLQVTERNGWQKDQGEPAISPDGRFLYYSQDVTPGQTFEYNKNVHAGIYAILRRDLRTGDVSTVTGRAGGAITPVPSPNGTRLAFIRRVGAKSVLFLRDLESGREWPIFDRLDRDMQEAWAIHGVYTQYAWLPDGRALVIWGEGRIWRVDVVEAGADFSYQPIPYRVRVEQVVHEPLRFAQQVAPANVDVKMLRSVVTSPDGAVVAYSALGAIHTKRRSGGSPRPLVRTDGYQFYPSFSPDGRSMVFTTWSDSAHGRVRIARVDGGGLRTIVSEPGHYVEPSFSPDGRWIVYRSVGGDNTRGRLYSQHTGVFIVPADGSAAPRLLIDSGSEPQFDHTGERIYLRSSRGGNTVLLSVDLNGGDEIVHFQSENATQIVPSPDGRWVAFAERYHAYVAAFPHTGRTITLGPNVRGFPVTRISRDAGMYLHWSGDSRRVHWTLGPEYFTRDLGRSFTFLEQGITEADDPESAGVAIGFSVPSPVPARTIALTNARIITMAGAAPGEPVPAGGVIENGTIVVTGNRITAIGPSAAVTVPAGAESVDVSGRTIMPGIIDVHAHVGGESGGLLAQRSWPLLANLAFGVTTSHDPSNSTETVFSNAELIRAGMKPGPRLFSTGTILYGAESPSKAVIENYEDALSHIRRMQKVGAFSVKSYNHQRRDHRQMLLRAARELNMMVVPEGGSLYYFNASMVIDGHTGVEHSLPVPRVYRDIATLFAENDVGYTPTLVVGFGGLSGEIYWYQHTDVWSNPRLLRWVPEDVVLPLARRRTMANDDDWNHIAIAGGAKRIHDAGGLVNLGAHGQMQGLGAHWELWSFVQGGMSPYDALMVATINGARYLGLDGDIGSLEAGKLADLVILDANPLDDIRNSERIRMVMINGVLLDPDTLD